MSLRPSNLFKDAVGATVAPLCAPCANAARARVSAAGEFSFFHGYDFGCAAALGLPTLTLPERLLVSWVRVYGHVVQVTETAAGCLNGHLISFEHSAPVAAALTAVADLLDPARVMTAMAVYFVAPAGKEDPLRRRLLGSKLLLVRHVTVLRWLTALQALSADPRYRALKPDDLTAAANNAALIESLDSIDKKLVAAATFNPEAVARELLARVGSDVSGAHDPADAAAAGD